jgi:hypothetical protein
VIIIIIHSFTTILTGLRAVLAARAATDRALTALLVLVWSRLARLQTRLERLIANWRAGTLPTPRPSRAGQPRKPTPKPYLPTTPAWLIARVQDAAPFGSQLQHALSDPDLAAFLAAAPQAGRLLRPLCRMLGVELPAPPCAVSRGHAQPAPTRRPLGRSQPRSASRSPPACASSAAAFHPPDRPRRVTT